MRDAAKSRFQSGLEGMERWQAEVGDDKRR